jgi:hypothetical protein
MASIPRFIQRVVPLPPLKSCAFTVKEKLALLALFMAFFAVTMYRVVVLTSVGIPLTVQVVLSILKPAGGYTKIYSTDSAFAAIKTDGTIAVWGASDSGGTGAPSGNSYTKIYSNLHAFAALKADGSITTWGGSYSGGTGAPGGKGTIS